MTSAKYVYATNKMCFGLIIFTLHLSTSVGYVYHYVYTIHPHEQIEL